MDSAKKYDTLVSFHYSSAGGMTGGHDSLDLILSGDRALISSASAQWYGDDATVAEYFTDPGILGEIEKIFKDNDMETWEGAVFSDVRIFDGATESYEFRFRGGSLRFSSQVFGMPYREPLNRIHQLVDEYAAKAEKLPGLVLPALSPEENRDRLQPRDGKVRFEAYRYSADRLFFRIVNGLDTALTVPPASSFMLVKSGESLPLFENRLLIPSLAMPHFCLNFSVSPTERLTPGIYQCSFGDLQTEFEIK